MITVPEVKMWSQLVILEASSVTAKFLFLVKIKCALIVLDLRVLLAQRLIGITEN